MLVPKFLDCALLLLISHNYLILCMSTEHLFDGVLPLSPENKKLLDAWTEDSEQNIWELSGQFEGDMILNSQRNGLIDTDYRWPNGVIPYKFATSYNAKQRRVVQRALADFQRYSCIRPRPATSRDTAYVVFTRRKSGCFSDVGRQGRTQVINLGEGCIYHGTVIHEFLHALGFHHQQSSPERDNYVQIIWDNIEDDERHNFQKYGWNYVTNFNEKYDYNSVMHYSAYAFAKDKTKKTIVTTNPRGAPIGQSYGFSRIDIIKLNKMYNCY